MTTTSVSIVGATLFGITDKINRILSSNNDEYAMTTTSISVVGAISFTIKSNICLKYYVKR